jgi:hypothetical protein
MDEIFGFLSVVGFAVGVIAWCVAAWSQVHVDREILPWARNIKGGARIGTVVMFRPELLTPKGQEHRRRLLFSLGLFCADLLILECCYLLRGHT